MNDAERKGHRIAVVGMGCRFGGAQDLHEFWDQALAGRDAFAPVPRDRWDHSVIYDPNPRAADKTCSDKGAFIDDIRSFPAVTLQIPPRRVEVMDPQHRLALECALQAIDDAGHAVGDVPSRTGVYMGVTANEFRHIVTARTTAQVLATGDWGSVSDDTDALAKAVDRVVPARPFSAAGVLTNMAAAIVAQELHLTGPAFSVDAACSSAMVAIGDAVMALRTGQVDAALAGGVYLCMSPDHYVAFSRIGAMSRKGACRPFDQEADGFVQGDGCGVLYLKRLEDAERDGDRVYALLEGMALNNDGGTDGPMAPVKAGQMECIELAWRDAGRDSAALGYVEAHGTGTQVGDRVEFQGINETLGGAASDVVIGSAKANIGHTMSAAGVAGVIRASLSLYHGIRPPMAGFQAAKPDLGIEGTPFRIPTDVTTWDADERVACVSAFGFGGTNGHFVLRNASRAAVPAAQPELVLISAGSTEDLQALALRTAEAIDRDPLATPASVARAWSKRRQQAFRAAVVADSRENLVARLREIGAGDRPLGCALGTAGDDAPKVAFLYPGQGAQRVGMLAGIRDRFPIVAQTLDELDAAVEGITALPTSHYLYPERRTEAVSEETAVAELTATQNCQPALLACGVALTRLLAQAGVVPHVVAGHSVGEFSAAVTGGVMSAADGARWTATRGRAMAELPLTDTGAMAAIVGDVDKVRTLLVDGAVLANLNHPRQAVVSGTTEAVEAVAQACEREEMKAVRLNVSHAFHSPVFANLDLNAAVDGIALSDPTTPVASCIQDHPYNSAAEARAVFKAHATSPVMFTQTLKQCVDLGADLILQVGAGGPILSFAKGTLRGVPLKGMLSAASKHDDDFGASFLSTLGELWVRGVPVDAGALTAAADVASVPPTVLPREHYWPVRGESVASLKMAKATGAHLVVQAPVQVAVTPIPSVEAGLAAVVIAAVARASSYPESSLKTSMKLIDDLGFDSMMVADLAEELTKAIPGVQGIPQEILVNAPTIQDLIDFAENPGAYGGSDAADDDAPLERFALQWRPSPLPNNGSAVAGHAVLVAGPGEHTAYAQALKTRGAELTTDPALPCDTVLYIASGLTLPTVSAVLADEAETPDLAGDFVQLLDELASQKRTPNVVVIRDALDPWAESLAGATRALGRDWTGSACKVIAFADGTPEQHLALAFNEVAAGKSGADTTTDVRYANVAAGSASREVLGTKRIAERAEPWTPTADDTIVITGGTRGIGLKLAQRLAPSGARIVLAGRSAPSENAAALIAGSQGRISHCAVDVTDRAAVKVAFAPYAPVTGFIHAAGVLADGPLGDVPADTGRAARAVKAAGFLNTLVAVNGSLKVAMGIGSWAGRFGNRHQVHYAAANAQLAELTQHLPSRIRGVCSEFGPWTNSDMGATIPEAVQSAMRAEGIDFVGDDAGLDALLQDLGGSQGVMVRGRRVATTTRRASKPLTMSVQTHPYLADHAIQDTPVLPLAGAANLLASTSNLSIPFEISDLTLFHGVTVKEPAKLVASAVGDTAEIRSNDGKTLHYRATVRPLSSPVEAPERLTEGGAPELDLAHFYSDVTFHGPLLQGITNVRFATDASVSGTVRTVDPALWVPGAAAEPWPLDPLAFDSAMQLAAFVLGSNAAVGTPVGFDRFVQLQPTPGPGAELTADVRVRAATEGDKSAIDIALWDAAGTLIAVCDNLVIQRRDLGQDEAADAAPSEDGRAASWEGFKVKPEWVDANEFPGYKDLQLRFQMVEALGLQNPYFDLHEGTARDTSLIAGRECINFSSYNYLGLSGDQRVIDDVSAAMAQYGTSVSASRIASGERPFHRDLEALLASSLGVEDAVAMPSGHATNVTVIGHLFGPNDLILHDELIHDSCLQGIKLSGAKRRSFRHEDIAHAEEQLKALRPNFEKVLLLTEGVYSMDGDISNTPEFVRLKQTYGCMLMVDEAHSFGTVGERGLGVRDYYGLEGPEVDLWMGTMSKSLASSGGWIAGTKALITNLRYTTPGFVFAAGMPPMLGQAALSSLRLIHEEPWRVHKLQSNAKFFAKALKERGLDIGVAEGLSPVVPVVTGSSMNALKLAQALLDKGINAKPIIFPAVPDDAARLRFFLSTCHTEEQLDHTAETCRIELDRINAE